MLTNMATVTQKGDQVKNGVLNYFEHLRSHAPKLGRIFLFATEQLDDDDSRIEIFKNDLKEYLHFKESLPSEMPHSDTGSRLSTPYYLENKLDICDDAHRDLRSKLLARGKDMSSWLLDYFLESDDVVVSSPDNLKNILKSYSIDPCLEQ